MLENHAIPRTGLFSQYPNLQWDDSTWGFDFLLGVAYRIFGLRAIPLFSMVLKVAVAAVTFLLARSRRSGFWWAVVLAALSQFVLAGLQPLPYVFSILFFAIELRILLSSRDSGSERTLYWLPLLFLVWANLHIQFVVGLILLAAFLITLLTDQWLRSMSVRWLNPRSYFVSVRQVSVILALSVFATFVTPYGFRPFAAFLKTSYCDVAFEHFAEMSAISFRRPQDYALMLLVMMAYLALGRRRSLDVFESLLLLAGTGVAFRIQRDSWMVALIAIAVVSTASFLRNQEKAFIATWRPSWQWVGVVAGTAIVCGISAVRMPDRQALTNRINSSYPTKACDYIRTNKLPAPLFNEYSFGSFLTWYMPEYPVAADVRVELYGNALLSEYFDVISGKERLDSHPMVARAGTLLLERNSAMAKALTSLPALRSRYRLVYSDEPAYVFVPQGQSQNR